MATFEEDRSGGGNRNRRSWGHPEHRTPPRRSRNTKGPREPYLRLDNRKLFRRDLEQMDDEELEDIVARLRADNESISKDIPSLSGDAEIKAKDKKRFNEQWIDTICDKLLKDDFEDDYEDDGAPADREEINAKLETPEGRRELAEAMVPPIREKLEMQACMEKESGDPIHDDKMVRSLLAAINRHLSPELAAIVLNDATSDATR